MKDYQQLNRDYIKEMEYRSDHMGLGHEGWRNLLLLALVGLVGLAIWLILDFNNALGWMVAIGLKVVIISIGVIILGFLYH